MKREFYKAAKDKRGLSLIELIIVIAIMAILVGVLTPMFIKYVDRARKSKDIYTADQIARAVNVAFVENPDAYDVFQSWTSMPETVSVVVNGEMETYKVNLFAANGMQDTNKKSNCFNGKGNKLYEHNTNGSDGFYGTINRELGLSTSEINTEIIPQYKVNGYIDGVLSGKSKKNAEKYADRWRIVKNNKGMMEIWVAQPDPYGGYPIYRLWPEPDDLYRK